MNIMVGYQQSLLWCLERSHKHSYNAKSGVGTIFGAAIKKLLFIGVRNKYYSVYAISKWKNSPPPSHQCYCNWSGTSCAMEANVIAKGSCYQSRCIELGIYGSLGMLCVPYSGNYWVIMCKKWSVLIMPLSAIRTILKNYSIQNIEEGMIFLQLDWRESPVVLIVQLRCTTILEMLLHLDMTYEMPYSITLVTINSIDHHYANIPQQIQVMYLY